MTSTPISQANASGSDITMLVEMLNDALSGVPDGHQIISCLAKALIIQKPDLTEEQVRDGVQDVSNYMCLWLDGQTAEPLSEEEQKRRLN